MESNNQLLAEELKELNKNLKDLKDHNRFMVYSASPFKFVFFNFIGGLFRSLGVIFAYFLLFGVMAWVFSKINIGERISLFLEDTLGNIHWEKVMPGMPSLGSQNNSAPSFKLEDLNILKQKLSY